MYGQKSRRKGMHLGRYVPSPCRRSADTYTRILGDLKKLELGRICSLTVVNILKEASLDPGPKQGEGTPRAEYLHRSFILKDVPSRTNTDN